MIISLTAFVREQVLQMRLSVKILLMLSILGVAHCASFVKIPVVSHMPPEYAAHMTDVKLVTIVPPVSSYQLDTGETDWSVAGGKALQTALGEQRFFVVIDGTAEADNLIPFTTVEQPRPKPEAAIAKKLGVDGILYMEITGLPSFGCSTQRYETRREECTGSGTSRTCRTVVDVRYESTLMTTLPVRGMLVSAKTQKIIQHSENAVGHYTTSGTGCVSESYGTLGAIEVGARLISAVMSPTVTDLKVPLDADAVGSPPEKESAVKVLLKEGVAHAEKQEFRISRDKWAQALELSEEKSPAAYWDMGIYFWMAGDYESASEHFGKSQQLAPERITGNEKKVVALNKFIEEKARHDATQPARGVKRKRKK